jgi:hypothetical protein
LLRMAWLYGPIGSGALFVFTISFMRFAVLKIQALN